MENFILSFGLNFSNDKSKTRFINHMDLFKRADNETARQENHDEAGSKSDEGSKNDLNDADNSNDRCNNENIIDASSSFYEHEARYSQDLVEDYYKQRVEESIDYVKNK